MGASTPIPMTTEARIALAFNEVADWYYERLH
jgi:hypothetical protein